MVTTPFMFLHFSIFIRFLLSRFLVPLRVFCSMDGGSPSRCKEKRSKKNQDHATIPRPSGHTKAACPRVGAGGSRVARRRDEQGSSAAAPPPAPTSVRDVPIVDAEEEALEHAGRTIAAPPVCTPTTRPGFVS